MFQRCRHTNPAGANLSRRGSHGDYSAFHRTIGSREFIRGDLRRHGHVRHRWWLDRTGGRLEWNDRLYLQQ